MLYGLPDTESANPISCRLIKKTLIHQKQLCFGIWLHTHTHICLIYMHTCTYSPGSSAGKESGCDTGDHGSILGSGRSPREGICYPLQNSWASLMAQMVKNLPIVQEIWVGKIPWRRAWQPIPVLLPGESPWTEESSGIQSMGSQRVRHTHDYIHI